MPAASVLIRAWPAGKGHTWIQHQCVLRRYWKGSWNQASSKFIVSKPSYVDAETFRFMSQHTHTHTHTQKESVSKRGRKEKTEEGAEEQKNRKGGGGGNRLAGLPVSRTDSRVHVVAMHYSQAAPFCH